MVGMGLNSIEPNEATIKNKRLALINDELCINCGKCYMTCNDVRYLFLFFNLKKNYKK